jgi:tetratricopeptide (TPR) repeat protein
MKKILSFLILASSIIYGQLELPRLSPKAEVYQRIGYTDISIEYSRPGVKGRKIWGGLVPYDKVWRTGANESTRIKFTTDVIINGQTVPAGIYSIFTIPSQNEWTVILNKKLGWGLDYDPELDLMRFKVKPEKTDFTERLLFLIPEFSDSVCTVEMRWENLKISFDITIKLNEEVYKRIKEALAKAGSDDWQVYLVAARYAAENGVFLDEAGEWIEKALSITKNFYTYLIKAKLLYRQGKFAEALDTLELCREAGRNNDDYPGYVYEVDLLEKRIREKLN